MAKRFTDTDKWKREWFSELPNDAKLVWFYLLDQCDHRGVWFRNFKLMSAQLGFVVYEQNLIEWFKDKIVPFDDDKFFIPSFVEFQYSTLNQNNNAHKSVIELVEKFKKRGPHKDLTSPSQGAQDKVTVTDKVLVKVKEEGECEGIFKNSAAAKFENSFKFDFKALLASYPNHRKTNISIDLLNAKIRTQADYDRLTLAIANYRAHCEKVGTEFRFTMQFPNFLNEWEDWENPELTKNKFEKKNGIQEWIEQNVGKDEPA